MNIGISETDQKNVVELLNTLLASTYVLYLKTQNFHWNVTGPMFQPLHALFETQYTALALSIDEVAERIRALGAFAPASLTHYLGLSWIDEANQWMRADAMVAQLLEDHEALSRNIRESFDIVAESGDEVTADLLIQRMNFHEKTAWMLRAVID